MKRISRTDAASETPAMAGTPDKGSKRPAMNVVSPNSAKKKTIARPIHYEKKEWGEIQAKNLMGNNSELYCLELQGGIELISCDHGQNEGFIQPFTAKYFYTRKDDRDGQKVFRDLKEKTHIIAMVPRRMARERDEPIMKPPGKADNGVARFKKCYLVRFCPGGSTSEEKEMALRAIAEVRHKMMRLEGTCFFTCHCTNIFCAPSRF